MKNPQHKSNSVHDELTHRLSELASHDEVAHHVHQHSLSTRELSEGYITQEVHHPDVRDRPPLPRDLGARYRLKTHAPP